MSQRVSNRRETARLLCALAALFALVVNPALAQAPAVDGQSFEYFVRQSAEQALVIRVNPFEAGFRARVTGPKGEVLREATLAGSRSLPLFLFVDGADAERQLDIRIDAAWRTRETRFDLEFSRLDVRDDLSLRLARAYQLLSFGQEALKVESAPNWTVKISMLTEAADAFHDYGMEEPGLQALLSAAHLSYFKLGDGLAAQEFLDRAMATSRQAGLSRPLLSALMLQGEMLAGQAGTGDPEASARALAALDGAREQAAALGWNYEQAHAGYLAGQVLVSQGNFVEALARFQAALDIALERQAVALSTDIRERLIEVHDRLGDVVAKEAELGNVVEQLSGGGAQGELIRNLLEQAGLYMGLGRYPDAIESLEHALAVDDNSLTRTQAMIMMGLALFESGRFARAESLLQKALIHPDTDVFRRPSALLPLAEGLAALAAIYRWRGDFAEAQRVRRIQGRHVHSGGARAAWAYERVVDFLAAGDATAAVEAWRAGGPLFDASGGNALGALAQLALCAGQAGGAACRDGDVAQAVATVQRTGNLRMRLAAAAFQARVAAHAGTVEAARRYAALLEDIHLLQSELPGLAGAWYWENRERLFAGAIRSSHDAGSPGAEDSLLSLARIVQIGRCTEDAPAADALRADLRDATGARVNEVLSRLRGEFEQRHAALSREGLRRFLQSMDRDEAVLAIDLEGRTGRAWLARREGVRQVDLRLGPEAERVIRGLRGAGMAGEFAPGELQKAGRALLGELAGELPGTLFVLPTGSVLGLPLAALLPDAGEPRRMALLDSFPLAPEPGPRMSFAPPERVFLGADPVDWTSDYPERLTVSAEVAAVTGRFVGPRLHAVLANALLADEFDGPRLREAQLLHLSLPGVLDLADPRASYLELSEPGRATGRDRMRPAQIRQWSLNAGLAVLTGVSVPERVPGRFDSRTALVDDLLDAGAGAVLLGPASGTSIATFLDQYYAELEKTRDIALALSRVRSAAPEAAAGFRLYLR